MEKERDISSTNVGEGETKEGEDGGEASCVAAQSGCDEGRHGKERGKASVIEMLRIQKLNL